MKYLANKKTKQIFNGHIPRYDKDEIVTDGKPVKTGRIIDGKEEWIKRINIGALPSTGSSDETFYDTGLEDEDITLSGGLSGIAIRANDNFPLPFVGQNWISLNWKSATNKVGITCTTDRSNMTGIIEIYFIYNN